MVLHIVPIWKMRLAFCQLHLRMLLRWKICFMVAQVFLDLMVAIVLHMVLQV